MESEVIPQSGRPAADKGVAPNPPVKPEDNPTVKAALDAQAEKDARAAREKAYLEDIRRKQLSLRHVNPFERFASVDRSEKYRRSCERFNPEVLMPQPAECWTFTSRAVKQFGGRF